MLGIKVLRLRESGCKEWVRGVVSLKICSTSWIKDGKRGNLKEVVSDFDENYRADPGLTKRGGGAHKVRANPELASAASAKPRMGGLGPSPRKI